MEKAKFCPALWFSGFFALGALVHLARSIFGFSLIVAGHEIPLIASVLLGLVLGVLSVALFFIALKAPCKGKQSGGEKVKGGCCHL